jgi:hypothetical protein
MFKTLKYRKIFRPIIKTATLFFIVAVSSVLSFSQTQKQWLKYAEKSFEEKDYYGASIYYREAMVIDSSNLSIVYQYAECLRLIHNYKLAETYYKYVVVKDKSRAFKESIFWLGMMQKNNRKYIDARKNFITYSKSNNDKDSYYFKKSVQEIKSCEYALTLIKNPVKAIVFNIGDSVNSPNSEFAAVKLNDSTFIYSSFNYNPDEKIKGGKEKQNFTSIYKAEKSDTLWISKGKIDSTINKSNHHSANGSYSSDKKYFYFSRCDDTLNCKIYVSELVNDSFKVAKPLNEKINLEGYINTQAQITVIDSIEYLFFVSNRPNGFGRLDIWYSKKENGDFTEPQNAGTIINSIDDEVSPYYDVNENKLYFSSAWHYGLGGFDVFSCSGIPDRWDEPTNIGYPLNSSVNDLYFSIDESNSGFISSNRIGSRTKEHATCCNDIWEFYLIKEVPRVDTIVPVVKKQLLTPLQTFLPIKLYFHNDEPNPRTKDTTTSLNYSQTLVEYQKLIPDYKENYSKGLKGDKKQIAEDSIDSFFNNQVVENYKHLEEFTEFLLKALGKGLKLDLTVKGHASPLANSDYNVNLTLRRIASLENYLKEYKQGILAPYLSDSASNGGSLRIIRIPFGEYKAEEFVSDNLNDKRNSVYSISAALNRNIEIVSVTLEHKDSTYARMNFRKEVFNFKEISSSAQASHAFKFKNIGNAELKIVGMESTCSCLSAKASSTTIAPGQSGEILVEFDPSGLKGKKVYTVSILTNGVPDKKEISITAEIK